MVHVAEVDHRNLISLTGGPPNQSKSQQSRSKHDTEKSFEEKVDKKFHAQTSFPLNYYRLIKFILFSILEQSINVVTKFKRTNVLK